MASSTHLPTVHDTELWGNWWHRNARVLMMINVIAHEMPAKHPLGWVHATDMKCTRRVIGSLHTQQMGLTDKGVQCVGHWTSLVSV